jgi:hypothetical protein
MSADRKGGDRNLTRRQFLQLGLAGLGAVALGGLAQPGTAAAAGLRTDAGAGTAAAKPAESKPATAQAFTDAQSGLAVQRAPIVVVRQSLDVVTIPVPTDFSPNNGAMKNTLLTEAPFGVYVHPKARLHSENWPYRVYLANLSDGAHLESDWPGNMKIQSDRALAVHGLAMGTLTSYEGQDRTGDYVNGTHGTGELTAWIRTQPNRVGIVYNPDNGQKLGEHRFNDRGDGGVILTQGEGRRAIRWTVDDPKIDTFETRIEFGAYDDKTPKRNVFDAR